jgi:hypothetical protein
MGLVCGYALWRGGRPERLTALASLGAWLLSRLVFNYRDWVDPQWAVLAVDVAFLIALTTLAVTTDRTWALFAAAFQLLGVIIHLAITLDHGIRALAYVRGLVIWSYLVLIALGVGTWLHARRSSTSQA